MTPMVVVIDSDERDVILLLFCGSSGGQEMKLIVNWTKKEVVILTLDKYCSGVRVVVCCLNNINELSLVQSGRHGDTISEFLFESDGQTPSHHFLVKIYQRF
jgi:hypothetical protein